MTANVPERLEWSGKNGAEERFFCMTAEPGASFEEELQSLMARYRNLGGGEEDEFLLRFHVSDCTWTSLYDTRLEAEIEMLRKTDTEGYFLTVCDILRLAEE